ncbi:hypothetical protein BV372_06220 [Nostoc sp. T09]|nr:hypothetical protein BV372_06220 [Nostoc sp. T09]
MLKVAVIPVMAVFSCLSISNTALADYLNSEGTGGDYRYELWSSDDNSNYYLKIWLREVIQESNAYKTTKNFTSSREALIYFDCNYAGKNLPECHQ